MRELLLTKSNLRVAALVASCWLLITDKNLKTKTQGPKTNTE